MRGRIEGNIEVTEYGSIKIHQEEARYGLRPSGDMLFSSLGFNYKKKRCWDYFNWHG